MKNLFVRAFAAFAGYVGFEGRIGRSGYLLYYFLPAMILMFGVSSAKVFEPVELWNEVVYSADGEVLRSSRGELDPAAVVAFFAFFLALLPGSVKRLHDSGFSGWALWAALIPFAGFIFLFVMLFVAAGDFRKNKYGAIPTGRMGLRLGPCPK